MPSVRGISISIFCTDKGQHPWTVLGDLTVTHGLLRANQGFVYGEHADRKKRDAVWLDHLDSTRAEYRVHMHCGRCGRHVQWSHDRAITAVQGLCDTGMDRLDISAVR